MKYIFSYLEWAGSFFDAYMSNNFVKYTIRLNKHRLDHDSASEVLRIILDVSNGFSKDILLNVELDGDKIPIINPNDGAIDSLIKCFESKNHIRIVAESRNNFNKIDLHSALCTALK